MSEFAKLLLAHGYSFVCAHCVKLHIGYRRGDQGCHGVLEGRDCGGPIAGLVFPYYEGPLKKIGLAKVCFRCGAEATELVEVRGKGFVGSCSEHLVLLKKLKPVDSVVDNFLEGI